MTVDSYVSTPQALQKIHTITRRVIALNRLQDSFVRISPPVSLGIGATAVDVQIYAAPVFTFTVVYSIFDSDNELAVRISRELEKHMPLEHVTGHELIYCWCGHSGDSWLDERRDHILRSGGLSCSNCPDDALAVLRRPRRLSCPCCSRGTLPFDTARGRIQYCRTCNGLGYLKPASYGVSPGAGHSAPYAGYLK